MAEDKCLIIVPPIKFVNSTLIKTDPIIDNVVIDKTTNLTDKAYTTIDETVKLIEDIAKSITDDIYLENEQGVDGVGFNLRPYSNYNISGEDVNFYIDVIVTPSAPTKITSVTPSNQYFNIYATEFLRLYNLPKQTTTTTSSSSNKEQTVTVGGSTKQEYEQKKRV